jgi:chemotaxis protein CheD
MSEMIVVGISDYKLGCDPDVIVTHALGSCVGICIYDRRLKIGGLSHIMLPDSTMFSAQSINRMKFADTAIEDMVQKLKIKGADVTRLTAKIAGGAQMFAVQENSAIGAIGARNIQSVKVALAMLRIPILAEDTGLNYGRTVYFDLNSGIMKVQSLNKIIKEL